MADDPALQPACDALVYLRDTLENLFALGDLDAYHTAATNIIASIDTVIDLVPPDIVAEADTPTTRRLRTYMEQIQQTTSTAELDAALDDIREAGDASLEGGPRFATWLQESCPTV